MKKLILIVLSLMILFSGCCREEAELGPSITYKVGIIHDTTLQQRRLALEFQSSFGSIEEINFESVWIFKIEGTPIYLELHETDFDWSKNDDIYRGICKLTLEELSITPETTHQGISVQGSVKINSK